MAFGAAIFDTAVRSRMPGGDAQRGRPQTARAAQRSRRKLKRAAVASVLQPLARRGSSA